MKIALAVEDLENIKEEYRRVTHGKIPFSVVLSDCLSYWLNNCVVLNLGVNYETIKAELPSVVRFMEFTTAISPNRLNKELIRQLYSLTFYIVVNEVAGFLNTYNMRLNPMQYRYTATADEYALYLGVEAR